MHERVGIQSTSHRPKARPAPANVTALAAFVALVMAGVIRPETAVASLVVP
jgi:hypothetical protein